MNANIHVNQINFAPLTVRELRDRLNQIIAEDAALGRSDRAVAVKIEDRTPTGRVRSRKVCAVAAVNAAQVKFSLAANAPVCVELMFSTTDIG